MAARRTKLTFNADGVTEPVPVDGMSWIGALLYGDGGVISGGVATLQHADWEPVEATPIPEAAWVNTAVTLNASGASAGAQTLPGQLVGAYSWVRLKLTTPLSGAGTVTGVIVANGA